MVRGIVLDEFACISRRHFMLMGCSFRSLEVKAIFFRPVDDCGQGDALAVFFFQTVFDIAVVVTPERHLTIFNQLLINRQFFQDGGSILSSMLRVLTVLQYCTEKASGLSL